MMDSSSPGGSRRPSIFLELSDESSPTDSGTISPVTTSTGGSMWSSYVRDVPKKRLYLTLDDGISKDGYRRSPAESPPVASELIKVRISASLTPSDIEAFIRRQAGFPPGCDLFLRLEDQQGFAVPYSWDDLEDNGRYILRIVQPPTTVMTTLQRFSHARGGTRRIGRKTPCSDIGTVGGDVTRTPAPSQASSKTATEASASLSTRTRRPGFQRSKRFSPAGSLRTETALSSSDTSTQSARSTGNKRLKPTPLEDRGGPTHDDGSAAVIPHVVECPDAFTVLTSSADTDSGRHSTSSHSRSRSSSEDAMKPLVKKRCPVQKRLLTSSAFTRKQDARGGQRRRLPEPTREGGSLRGSQFSTRWIRPVQYVKQQSESPSKFQMAHESGKDSSPGNRPEDDRSRFDNSEEATKCLASDGGDDDVIEERAVNDVMTIFRRVEWLTLGHDHPEPLAESDTLASVSLPKLPDSLEVRIPLEVAEEGLLSNPQLENLIYASRTFERVLSDGRRAGYFLGEGTGCGKGRVIAASIWHLWNLGYRRHLWVSVSADLVQDAMRDLADIGAGHIPVVDLTNVRVLDCDSKQGHAELSQRASRLNKTWAKWSGQGVLFVTYTLLSRSANQKEFLLEHTEADAPVKSRLGQILKWMAQAPREPHLQVHAKQERSIDGQASSSSGETAWKFRPTTFHPGGLLCFDEAHRAKNLVTTGGDERVLHRGTATGIVVQKLQDVLRHCPVLYASATGATELRHLAYMSRLGLWGPRAAFSGFQSFRETVERGAVTAMECLAMDLKAAGMYSCRTLSFCGVAFHTVVVESTLEFIAAYDAVAELLTSIYQLMLARAASDMKDQKGGNKLAAFKSNFWSAQQRVVKQLLVSQKVDHAVSLASDAIQRGSQVVISLWGTGEARTAEKMREVKPKRSKAKPVCPMTEDDDGIDDGCADEFLSPPKLVLEKLILEKLKLIGVSSQEVDALAAQLNSISFPNNPLDDLIDKLGGPDAVAELSGRTKRFIWDGSRLRYSARDAGSEHMTASTAGVVPVNLREQRLFQSGQKKVAIITEAASAGISLHSDKHVPNPAPREMICIELPWAADKAVQQFGRVHRSNQRCPPVYHLLVSDIGGERRFVACIARRMKTLGAITRGDRRAAFGSNDSALTKISTPGDEDSLMFSPKKPNLTAGSAPFVAFDAYSKVGLQARNVLLRWLSRSVFRTSAESPGEVLPPLPEAMRERYGDTTEAFFQKVASLFVERGILETYDMDTKALRVPEKSKAKDMDRFLNRLLMLPVVVQNDVMDVFMQVYDELQESAELNGEYDCGVENLNRVLGISFDLTVASRDVIWTCSTSGAQTVHYHLVLDRGVSWKQAESLLQKRRRQHPIDGFYFLPAVSSSSSSSSGHHPVALVLKRHQAAGWGSERVVVFRPHLGICTTIGAEAATTASIERYRWQKARTPSELQSMKEYWMQHYHVSHHQCIHVQIWGHCRKGPSCKVGRRLQDEHVLTGNVISLWSRLERWFETTSTATVEDDAATGDVAGTAPRLLPARKALRMVRAELQQTGSLSTAVLVGARIPADRIGFIKRNLRTFNPIADDAERLAIQIMEAAARAAMFEEMMYLKFLRLIVQTVTASPRWSPKAVLSLDEIYTMAVEAVDELVGSTAWSPQEIDVVRRAFPADSSGLDCFDVFLRQGGTEMGISREFDPSQGSVSLFSITVTTVGHSLPHSVKQSLQRQREWQLYHQQHLETRQQGLRDGQTASSVVPPPAQFESLLQTAGLHLTPLVPPRPAEAASSDVSAQEVPTVTCQATPKANVDRELWDVLMCDNKAEKTDDDDDFQMFVRDSLKKKFSSASAEERSAIKFLDITSDDDVTICTS